MWMSANGLALLWRGETRCESGPIVRSTSVLFREYTRINTEIQATTAITYLPHHVQQRTLSTLSAREFGEWLACIQPDEGKSAIAVLKVSVDESGTHGNAPALVVAACVATPNGWKQIRRAWAPRAAKYPNGYHATKARDEDNLFLANLLPEHLEASLAVVVPYEVFKFVVPHEHRSRFGAEYATGIRACVHVLAYWCDHHWYDWTTWVLEAGHKGESSARQFLDSILRRPGGHVWSHAWVGKDDLVTHAPDVVSHAIVQKLEQDGRSPLLEAVLKSTVIRAFDRPTLQKAVTKGYDTIKSQRWEAVKARKARKEARESITGSDADALPGTAWEPPPSGHESPGA